MAALTNVVQGPRRQALAGKTTNIKAKNQGLSGGQKAGKKLDGTLKPQLVITEQAEPAVFGANDEVPEIEYMAPVPPGLCPPAVIDAVTYC